MRTAKRLGLLAALLAALSASGAGLAASGGAASGNLEAEFASRFAPSSIPEEKPAPVSFSFWGRIGTKDGAYPPALRGLRVRIDEAVGLSVESKPVCRLPGRDQRLDIAAVRKACRPAILGTGRIDVTVALPEQAPLVVESELLALNRGIEDGVPILSLWGYLPAPVTGALDIPVEVRKVRRGRYGTEAVAAVPKIANGDGTVTYFRVDFKRGVFRARCPRGSLSTKIVGAFANGAKASASATKRC